jgi:hypothetical protein
MFLIEDEIHAEPQKGEYKTFEDAYAVLQKSATILWDEKPNRCPCTNWKDCERKYQIIEYDIRTTPWKVKQRIDVLTISSKGIKWTTDK